MREGEAVPGAREGDISIFAAGDGEAQGCPVGSGEEANAHRHTVAWERSDARAGKGDFEEGEALDGLNRIGSEEDRLAMLALVEIEFILHQRVAKGEARNGFAGVTFDRPGHRWRPTSERFLRGSKSYGVESEDLPIKPWVA